MLFRYCIVYAEKIAKRPWLLRYVKAQKYESKIQKRKTALKHLYFQYLFLEM